MQIKLWRVYVLIHGDTMEEEPLGLQEVKCRTIMAFDDFRGYTAVLWDAGIADELHFQAVQINQGFSNKPYTLRGLHYQKAPYEQAKLVSCLHGSIYSVAVDIRPASDSFGKYVAEILSAENRKVMYVPKGFAHGYLTLEPNTLMQWCVDADFCTEAAQCLRWDDVSVNISWPLGRRDPVISEKDRNGRNLMEICI